MGGQGGPPGNPDQPEEIVAPPPREYLALRAEKGLSTDVLGYLKKVLPGLQEGDR